MRRALLIIVLILTTASVAGLASDAAAISFRHRKPRGCTVIVTGYNSQRDQTDKTPFLTASQTHVRWGGVAANWLPMGARVRIHGLKRKVFVVDDRTHSRHGCRLDIWFRSEKSANDWGAQKVFVEVLQPKTFTCPPEPVSVEHKCPEPS